MVLHRYDMEIVPEAAGRKRHWIVQLLLQSAEVAPHQGSLATDFRSTLILKTRFKQDQDVIRIQYRSEGEDELATGATVYNVHVRFTKSLNIGELVNWMNSTSLSRSFSDKN
jgi:eukaryotic translation initiation factor 2C